MGENDHTLKTAFNILLGSCYAPTCSLFKSPYCTLSPPLAFSNNEMQMICRYKLHIKSQPFHYYPTAQTVPLGSSHLVLLNWSRTKSSQDRSFCSGQ